MLSSAAGSTGVRGERGRGAASTSTHPLMEGAELSRVLSSRSPGEIINHGNCLTPD